MQSKTVAYQSKIPSHKLLMLNLHFLAKEIVTTLSCEDQIQVMDHQNQSYMTADKGD